MKTTPISKVIGVTGIAVFLAVAASAQVVIFSENFDSSLSPGANLNAYSFGDTTSKTTGLVPGAGVGGTGGWVTTNIAASGTAGYSGVGAQYQKGNVSGNTDPNLADYILSFDAKADGGSLNVQVQSWTGAGFGGTMTGTLSTAPSVGYGDDLTLNPTFTHYSFTLADPTIWHNNTGMLITGGTLQLAFQLNNGGATPYTHVMTIDNLSLVLVPEPSTMALGALGFAGLLGARRLRRN